MRAARVSSPSARPKFAPRCVRSYSVQRDSLLHSSPHHSKMVLFSTKPYDKESFERANTSLPEPQSVSYFDCRLSEQTLICFIFEASLAKGHKVVCPFVNDIVDEKVLTALKSGGAKRTNNVDTVAAKKLGLTVMRVPGYSPHAVAEHTVALLLTLNRHIHKAYNRVREGNFALDGLLGMDLHSRTVGLIGTGRIGAIVAQIMGRGFGCNVIAFDQSRNEDVIRQGVSYVPLPELYARSDIISLHLPLTAQTYHLINTQTLGLLKDGVMIINTSRGGLIDASAAVQGLKSKKIGGMGLDVYDFCRNLSYEEEGDLFFEDKSKEVLQDDVLARLLSFPNVLVTGHQVQGFFTSDALRAIAETTLSNVASFSRGAPTLANVVV